MERSQRPYSIYKRRSKKKKSEYYFYVRFRAEDSRYLPAVASHQTPDLPGSGCELGRCRVGQGQNHHPRKARRDLQHFA